MIQSSQKEDLLGSSLVVVARTTKLSLIGGGDHLEGIYRPGIYLMVFGSGGVSLVPIFGCASAVVNHI